MPAKTNKSFDSRDYIESEPKTSQAMMDKPFDIRDYFDISQTQAESQAQTQATTDKPFSIRDYIETPSEEEQEKFKISNIKVRNLDEIAGIDAAKKFLIANRGRERYQIYLEYNLRLNQLHSFNREYRKAFKEYAHPYGDFATFILNK